MSEVNGDRGPGSGVRDPGARVPAAGSDTHGSAIGADENVLAGIDRDLRALLAVSPSADFEARVVRRVEQDEPVRVGWFRAGLGLQRRALLAAASVFVVAGLFHALNRTPAVDPRPPAPALADRPPAVNPPPAGAPLAKEVARSAVAVAPLRAAAERTRRSSSPRMEPEVIVPLNQMAAVRRLVAAMKEGRIEGPAEPSDAPIAPPVEIAVPPLVVEPIPLPALEPGAATPQPNRGV